MNRLSIGAFVVAALALVASLFGGQDVVERVIEKQLGGNPGTSVSGCFSVNGVETCSSRVKFNKGTTTLAMMRAPTSASSTLVYASCTANSTLSTSTEFAHWVIARDTGPGPTTTALGAAMTLGGSGEYIVASTTDGLGIYVFGPGDWVNVKYQSQTTGNYAQVTDQDGTCTASWVVMN